MKMDTRKIDSNLSCDPIALQSILPQANTTHFKNIFGEIEENEEKNEINSFILNKGKNINQQAFL